MDFTVLAATSVLGDLIDKCPPAEACRDAFERMSKATVQMCLSTTGFGSRAPLLGPPKAKHARAPPSSQSNTQVPSYVQAQNDQGFFRPQRPRPQFDMNLRDLFPEEAQERSDVARNIRGWQFPPQSGPPPALTPQHSIYADLRPSPPSVGPAYQDPQRLSNQVSPYGQSFPMAPVPAPPGPQGLSGAGEGEGAGAGNGLGYPNPVAHAPDCSFPGDMDFLLADTTAQYTGNTGLSLGFDSEHDWSEGAGVDLFDGFFFGGPGGYGVGSAGGLGGLGAGDDGGMF